MAIGTGNFSSIVTLSTEIGQMPISDSLSGRRPEPGTEHWFPVAAVIRVDDNSLSETVSDEWLPNGEVSDEDNGEDTDD